MNYHKMVGKKENYLSFLFSPPREPNASKALPILKSFTYSSTFFFLLSFRYGFNEYTEYNFRVRLELQDSFEEKLGYPIYKLFKNEICEEIENDRVKKVVRFWK